MNGKTLCWTCANAYADKCIYHSQWHIPVPGWKAEKSRWVSDNGSGHKRVEDVPRVIECPLYKRDPREDFQEEPQKRETKRERQARIKRNMFEQAEQHKQRSWEETLERAEELMHEQVGRKGAV